MSAERYIMDAPVQRLIAGDRIIRCSEPELVDRTVVYVRSTRGVGTEDSPQPYGPITVVSAGEADNPGDDLPSVGWGTRCTIERAVSDDGNSPAFLVSAREPLSPSSRLTVHTTVALELTREEWPESLTIGADEVPHAGTVISALVDDGTLDKAPARGEVIDAYWYVDGVRVETPAEQSGREAADLFADHVVRLRPAGQDAGETCPNCGRIVSWLEHLPPIRSGEFVRCAHPQRRAV